MCSECHTHVNHGGTISNQRLGGDTPQSRGSNTYCWSRLVVVGDAVELCELDDIYVVHEGRLQFVVGIGTHASVMHRSSLWSTCLINRCANTVTIERKVCRFYNISPPLRRRVWYILNSACLPTGQVCNSLYLSRKGCHTAFVTQAAHRWLWC